MTDAPPIDILEIAAARLYLANEWVRATMAMNSSAAAELAYQNATIAKDAAGYDMAAAQWFAECLMGIRS